MRYAMRPRKGAIFCCVEKKIAIRPASALAIAHGSCGFDGCCRFGAGSKCAAVLIVSIVTLPEGLPAKTFAGLSVHVAFACGSCAAQLRVTSAGKLAPCGVVIKPSATLDGVPRMTCTIPGPASSIVKSILVSENVAEATAPVTDDVTL